jgi:signal transduction histidine kinase
MLAQIEAHDGNLRMAWHEAEAASRSKTEFLANMSHELRTPLNAIIGFSEVIKTEMIGPLGTDRYRFYAQDIYDSGHHLLEVINDILDISKVEAGEFELHEEPSDLRTIIEQAARLVHERAEADGLSLVVEVDRDLPELLIDARLIKQSLINLLSNAIKFTPQGGQVTVRAAQASDGSVLLSVTDTGIGIPERDVMRILQPFVQVESAFARKHGGTGLGLPLSKSFIEAHGGTIEVRSRLGEGTAVTLQFPAGRRVLVEERRVAASGPAE